MHDEFRRMSQTGPSPAGDSPVDSTYWRKSTEIRKVSTSDARPLSGPVTLRIPARSAVSISTKLLPHDEFQSRPDVAYGADLDVYEPQRQRNVSDGVLRNVRWHF